jgi:hypothetical protein
MLDYVDKFLTSDMALLSLLVEKTRINCPFCPENVKIKTPTFPKDSSKKGEFS